MWDFIQFYTSMSYLDNPKVSWLYPIPKGWIHPLKWVSVENHDFYIRVVSTPWRCPKNLIFRGEGANPGYVICNCQIHSWTTGERDVVFLRAKCTKIETRLPLKSSHYWQIAPYTQIFRHAFWTFLNFNVSFGFNADFMEKVLIEKFYFYRASRIQFYLSGDMVKRSFLLTFKKVTSGSTWGCFFF